MPRITTIQLGRWRLETGPFGYHRMRLTTGRGTVWLTQRQGRLLECLMQYPDQVVSREELLCRAWGVVCSAGDYRILEITLCALRRRIDPHKPFRVITTAGGQLQLHSEFCQ